MIALADLRVASLQYFVGATRIFCVVTADDGQAEKHELPPVREVFPLVESLADAIAGAPLGGSDRGLTRFSLEWGRRLLPPVEALARFDVLVVIPHYWLHQVPFQVVWLPERGAFLGEAFGLVYDASAAMLRQCLNRNTARRADLSQWRFGTGADDSPPAGAPPCPRRCAGVGVDVIGDLTPQYEQLGRDFTRHFAEPQTHFESATLAMPTGRAGPLTAFGRAEPMALSATRLIKLGLPHEGWDAVCLVCHGYHDDRSAQGSGLLLQRAELGVWRPVALHGGEYVLDFRDMPFREVPAHIRTRCEAEILTFAELAVECSTEAQLVALYGCHTAAGEISSAQAFNSIAYQWLRIGAASVIANMWEVDIELLTRFNPLFLTNWLVRRQPKAIALRDTVRGLRAADRHLAAARWGPMALFGDWL